MALTSRFYSSVHPSEKPIFVYRVSLKSETLLMIIHNYLRASLKLVMATERLLCIVITRTIPTRASTRASTLIKLAGDRVDNSLYLRQFLLECLCGSGLTLGLNPLSGLLGERQ